MKTIVYAATHPFSSPIRVGSHHIASQIARNHKVCYCSHPLSLASLINPNQNQIRSRSATNSAQPDADTPGMSHYLPKFLLGPGNRFPLNSPLVLDHCWRLSVPALRKQIVRLGFESPDWLILDSFYQSYWLNVLRPRKIAVRIADHPEAMGEFNGHLRRRFHAALAAAEFVVAASEATARYAQENGATRVLLCENGIDQTHLQQDLPVPEPFIAESRPIVVFVGALASWIDWELLAEVARQAKDISFYLIGPDHHALAQAEFPANITIVGAVSYQQMPAYLQHADAAIAPFNSRDMPQLVNSVSAIKLFEYQACGLAVVATRWPQSEALQALLPDRLFLSDQDPRRWLKALRTALSTSSPEVPPELLCEWDWSQRVLPILAELDAEPITPPVEQSESS